MIHNTDLKNKNINELTEKDYRNYDTPEDMLYILSKTDCCRNFFKHNPHFECWIDRYTSYEGGGYAGTEAKHYILYCLIFVLNELQPMSRKKFERYLFKPDLLIKEVISVSKEEKNWNLDKHYALALCAKILLDYACEELEYNIENEIEKVRNDTNTTLKKGDKISALRRIIRNYPHDAIYDADDHVWCLFFDQLLDLHDDNENMLYREHDIKELEYLVRQRIILPDCYDFM